MIFIWGCVLVIHFKKFKIKLLKNKSLRKKINKIDPFMPYKLPFFCINGLSTLNSALLQASVDKRFLVD